MQNRVALGDGRKIIGLWQRYAYRVDCVWWPETNTAEILFDETRRMTIMAGSTCE